MEGETEEGSFGTDGFVGVGKDFRQGLEDRFERDGFGSERAIANESGSSSGKNFDGMRDRTGEKGGGEAY